MNSKSNQMINTVKVSIASKVASLQQMQPANDRPMSKQSSVKAAALP